MKMSVMPAQPASINQAPYRLKDATQWAPHHWQAGAIVGLIALITLNGCSDSFSRKFTYSSYDETLELALPEDLKTSHPDVRRGAVTRLAESGDYDREATFYVLDGVARFDPVVQIRCIALRGLARYEDDRPVGTVFKILNTQPAAQGESSTNKEALLANGEVRWEALLTLKALIERDVLNDEARDLALRLCLKLAQNDTSRDVRLAATANLANFKDRQVLKPLIDLLSESDFALAERAELSLIALTGTTHEFDPIAWETWVANTADPFANAGNIPQTTRPAGPSWWEQQQRSFKRAIKLNNAD